MWADNVDLWLGRGEVWCCNACNGYNGDWWYCNPAPPPVTRVSAGMNYNATALKQQYSHNRECELHSCCSICSKHPPYTHFVKLSTIILALSSFSIQDENMAVLEQCHYCLLVMLIVMWPCRISQLRPKLPLLSWHESESTLFPWRWHSGVATHQAGHYCDISWYTGTLARSAL